MKGKGAPAAPGTTTSMLSAGVAGIETDRAGRLWPPTLVAITLLVPLALAVMRASSPALTKLALPPSAVSARPATLERRLATLRPDTFRAMLN